MFAPPIRALSAFTASLLVAGLLLIPASPAMADGNPDVQLTRSVDSTTLYGAPVAVTLEATQTTGPNGFNLSVTDIIPAGATVATSPTFPVSSTVLLGDGRTKVVWSNVADLLTGVVVTLEYTFAYNPVSIPVGTVLTSTAEAYVNSNARTLPRFDPMTGNIVPLTATGFDTDTSGTTLVPFTIDKSEPSPEGELLRGVQDHITVYSLTITNNSVGPSNDFQIVDHLPAGLEYLGCRAADNSALGAEYPGSGRIGESGFPTLADCVAASESVVVSEDPDGEGPLPLDIYSRVTLSGLDPLLAGATRTIQYAAGIPLRENVLNVDPATNATANLDNNTGVLTEDEQALTNHARLTGTYAGTEYADETTETVTAENVRLRKSANQSLIEQGAPTTWTLEVESSEYATSTDPITITDTIPDGLDFASSNTRTNSVTVNRNGTTTVVWILTGFSDRNGDPAPITYETRTRIAYLGTRLPVNSNDRWTNAVTLATDATVIVDDRGNTETRPNTVDASQASQTGRGITIDKRVAVRSDPLTPCAAVREAAWVENTDGFRQGDTVCWRLTATYPVNLDTRLNTITDFLPAGFTYVSSAYTTASNVAPAVPPVVDGSLLTWDLGAVDINGLFQVVVETRVATTDAIDDGDISGNLMKVTYQNTQNDVFQLRDQADATLTRPVLGLDKSAVGDGGAALTSLRRGEFVDYTLSVTNTGGAPAVNTSVRDLLPAGIECSDVGTIRPLGTCVDATRDYIQWDGLNVAVGTPTLATYRLTVPLDVSPGDVFINEAGVRTYDVLANDGVTTTTYTPESNIDPVLEANEDSPIADDTQTVRTRGATVTKLLSTALTDGGNNAPRQAAIGEIVRYTVTATIPEGTTLYGTPALTDVVNSRLAIVPGSATFTIASGAAQAATVVGQTITAPIPAPYVNLTNSRDDLVVLTFEARVLDQAGLVRNGTIANSATLSFETVGGVRRDPSGSSPTVQIVEPNIGVTKSSNAVNDRVLPDQLVNYTLNVRNVAGTQVSTAHDLVVVDRVPVDLIPLEAPGDPAESGDTLPGGGVFTVAGPVRTITFTIPSLAPGASAILTYPTRVANPVASDGFIVNNVAVTATSLAGTPTGERTAASPQGGLGSGYRAVASSSVQAPSLSLQKSVSGGPFTIGELATYTLELGIPAGVRSFDVTAVDTLPEGVRFGALQSVECTEAGVSCAPVVGASLVEFGLGNENLRGFFFDEIDSAAAPRTVTITYTGVVTGDANDGDNLENTARVFSNTGNALTEPPATPPRVDEFDTAGTPTTVDIDIVEPRLTIDKDVVGQVDDTDTRRAVPGDVLQYTVAVTNSGTSPAYDVIVTDSPDRRLGGYAVVGGAGFDPVDVDPSDGTLRWSVPGPIAAGATVSITYSLTVPAGLDETDEVIGGAEITNTADVPEYFGVAAAVRNNSVNSGIVYRDYDDVTPDTVELELDLASLGNRVWFDTDGDGTDDTGEPGIPGLTVSAVVGGATYTTTTNSNGAYLFENLPGGTYTVTVGGAAARGLTPTADLDGIVTANTWTGSLAENAAKEDVDFGYTGVGSIGDLVWFDRDRDGSVDLGEPGVPGVTVTVVWGGFDGDLSTLGDNIMYVDVTDDGGAYLVGRLPAGPYSVTVSTLPVGASVTTDPLGGASASVTTQLGAAEQERLQDFGIVGSGALGDLVWLDRNGNGERDLGGDPGIAGAVLEVRGNGADGIFDTADDAVFTATTNAEGLYGVTGLLPSDYRVTVTGGLPLSARNIADLDDDLDSIAEVTIGAGVVRLDLDFGYEAASIIGDRVWWDLNGDGVQDDAEPGLPGVGVRVLYLGFDGVEGTRDDLVFRTATDADGIWSVVDVPDGDYIVTVESGIPAGFAPVYDRDGLGVVADGRFEFQLADGSLGRQDVDFGYRGNSRIGDRVWLDLNGDGVQDAGEPSLPGVGVELRWFGPDAESSDDDVVLTATTNAAGNYLFVGLPEGNYRVSADERAVIAELEPTYDLDGGDDRVTVVSLSANTALNTVDFGFIGTGAIGSTVWLDFDGDAVRDAGEPGIPGVAVTLSWAGFDGLPGTEDDAVFETTTDSDGAYLFDRLPAGAYTVVLAGVPAGTTATADPDGESDSRSALILDDGEQNLLQNFGYAGDSGIGDLVWLDVDGDGVQTGREPGIVGLAVEVRHPGNDGLLDTADDIVTIVRTGVDGTYLVRGLPAGEVRVSYLPSDLADGLVGSSDLDGEELFTTLATLVAGEVRTDADFVVVGSARLDGIVFDDADGDGTRDPGERGLPGVKLAVVWAGPNGPVTIVVKTDSQGRWSLDGLPAGTYTKTVDRSTVAEEYRQTVSTGGSVVLLPFGSATAIDGFTTLTLPITGATISIAAAILLALMLLASGVLLASRRRGRVVHSVRGAQHARC